MIDQLFAAIDAELWDVIPQLLSEEIELADELTPRWLRGRERVAGYLRAQRGITTELRSQVSDLHVRRLTEEEVLQTFVVDQTYRFDGVLRHQSLTGSATVRDEEGVWRFSMLHVGQNAPLGAHDTIAPLDPGSIGPRIRAIREAQNVSLRTLAAQSGLSPGALSQIERGNSRPRMDSLSSIIVALGASVGELLQAECSPGLIRVETQGEHPEARLHEFGVTVTTLPGLEGGKLDGWLLKLEPDAAVAPAGAQHGEERLLYVLDGTVQITDGATARQLEAGDAAHVHRGRWQLKPLGPKTTRVLCVQLRSHR